jgi:hypothetical protein
MLLHGAWAHGRLFVGHWGDDMQPPPPWPRPAAVRARNVIRLVIAMSSIVMRLSSVDVSIESMS